MLGLLKSAELERLQPVIDYVHGLDPRSTIVVQEKKKNFVWLIVLLSVVAVAGAAFAVYKLFFDGCCDEFEDFDDEEFEDIDFDDDYDEEFDGFEETVEKVKEAAEETIEE